MPPVAQVLSRPLAVAIGGLAALRHARALHPDGTARHATADVEPGDHPLAGLAGQHAAVARTSRGGGLPHALPDVHGLVVRFLRPGADPTEDGGSVLDLLVSAAGSGRLTRHVLRPGYDPRAATYSSLAPYAGPDGERFVVGARFVEGAPDEVDLLVAAPGAAWRTVGRVTLGEPLPAPHGERLRFDPFTCPPWMEPVGALNQLRRPAYRASQARRRERSELAASRSRPSR